MHNYTIRLHKYAKLAARESRIWAQLLFRTKICENFKITNKSLRINYQVNVRHLKIKVCSSLRWGRAGDDVFRFFDKGKAKVLTEKQKNRRRETYVLMFLCLKNTIVLLSQDTETQCSYFLIHILPCSRRKHLRTQAWNGRGKAIFLLKKHTTLQTSV